MCRLDGKELILAIPGLNPTGGLPSESVQFYHHDKIVLLPEDRAKPSTCHPEPAEGSPAFVPFSFIFPLSSVYCLLLKAITLTQHFLQQHRWFVL